MLPGFRITCRYYPQGLSAHSAIGEEGDFILRSFPDQSPRLDPVDRTKNYITDFHTPAKALRYCINLSCGVYSPAQLKCCIYLQLSHIAFQISLACQIAPFDFVVVNHL